MQATAAVAPENAITQMAPDAVTVITVGKNSSLAAPMFVSMPLTWVVFTVPISGTLTPRVGQTVELVGARNSSDETDELFESVSTKAIFLGTQEGMAVLGLPPTDARKASAYSLQNRRLVILQLAPTLPTPLPTLSLLPSPTP
ncbi:MAG: hypothetical protein M3441_04145 [Chloroflexota bacterium]|nr:hypothetical protein [Chloroflexota bacterium]